MVHGVRGDRRTRAPDAPRAAYGVEPVAHTVPMVGVSGIGSWPGSDIREALRVVRDELTEAPEGVTVTPYLPELPDRGPGADLVGRSLGLLVDLPVDLQPQGWRLVDHRGRDAERTASLWGQDLDQMAEVFDGWTGPFKVQVAGPWTLAAAAWLPLGDRVLSDPGATRELAESLGDGIAEHLATVHRLLPGAQPVLQVDEPTLPAVLQGRIRSESGYRTLRAPDPSHAEAVLRGVLDAARRAGAETTVVHCCGDHPPLALLRGSGADALAIDTTTFGPRAWESVAETVESGVRLWAGVLPTAGEPPAPADVVDPLVGRWREVGLEASRLDEVTVTPACGLAAATPDQALGTTRAAVAVARMLAEQALG